VYLVYSMCGMSLHDGRLYRPRPDRRQQGVRVVANEKEVECVGENMKSIPKSLHESLDPSRVTYADAHIVSPCNSTMVLKCSEVPVSPIVKIRPHDPFARMRTKLERDYGNHLEVQRKAGLIDRWEYEWASWVICDDVRYIPDFAVIRGDSLEFHETKGFWTDKGLIKFRLAKSCLPFRIIAVKRIKGEWVMTENPVRELRRGERRVK